ncbi:MAG TPA: helix-turn-helix domain-containing protein [Saprospiraceae bacterium]|nr:helix-turn-helix domain-containing protein [Saprospiraceae bacterium]HMQ83459.1 helix-turn-helix domain-containing protein [Saprospiraceae bacterium]
MENPFLELGEKLNQIESILHTIREEQVLSKQERKKEPNPENLLTKREAAQLLNVCTSTIDNYARAGELTRHYVGRVVRFKKAEVLAIASPPKKPTR